MPGIKDQHQKKKSLRQSAAEFIFSRRLFTEPYALFATGMLAAISTTSDYFLGDIPSFIHSTPNAIAAKRAFKDKNGVGIVRVGPKFWPRHLVTIVPKLKPRPTDLETQLRRVMNIDEQDARSPYDAFKTLTDSSFFLALAGKEGMELRKIVTAYFEPKRFFEASVELTHELLDTELMQPMNAQEFHAKIYLLIKKIIARVLFDPSRFIDNDGNPALNHGSHTPFGLGSRA